jgi:hypothetical protein
VVSLPETAYLIVALFGVFSLLVWIVELVLAKWDDRKAKAADRAKEDEVLCFLDTLAKQELHILAKALARNAQALSLGKLGVPLAMAHKGLLEPITNSQGDYIIPSFVWRRLKEQEQNIIARAKAVNPNETYEAKKAIDEGY